MTGNVHRGGEEEVERRPEGRETEPQGMGYGRTARGLAVAVLLAVASASALPTSSAFPTIPAAWSASTAAPPLSGSFSKTSELLSKCLPWYSSRKANASCRGRRGRGADQVAITGKAARLLGSRRLWELRLRLRDAKTRLKKKMLQKLLRVSAAARQELEGLETGDGEEDAALTAPLEDMGVSSLSALDDSIEQLTETELMRLVEMWAEEESSEERLPTPRRAAPSEALGSAPKPTAEPVWMSQWAPDAKLRAAVAGHPEVVALGDYTLGRFYSLGKGDPATTLDLCKRYVEWRNSKKYGVERVGDISVSSPGVVESIKTGKCYLLNSRTKQGCPLVVVKVKNHDPSMHTLDETTHFVIHVLFQAEGALHEPESSQYSIIFDMRDASLKNIDYKAVQRFITILTSYCPERLHAMLLYEAPGFFSSLCWPLIKPWLNPETSKKISFVKKNAKAGEGLVDLLGEDCVPVEYGGTDAFDYQSALRKGEAISGLGILNGEGPLPLAGGKERRGVPAEGAAPALPKPQPSLGFGGLSMGQ